MQDLKERMEGQDYSGAERKLDSISFQLKESVEGSTGIILEEGSVGERE